MGAQKCARISCRLQQLFGAGSLLEACCEPILLVYHGTLQQVQPVRSREGTRHHRAERARQKRCQVKQGANSCSVLQHAVMYTHNVLRLPSS